MSVGKAVCRRRAMRPASALSSVLSRALGRGGWVSRMIR
jgi:hypothetical protein